MSIHLIQKLYEPNGALPKDIKFYIEALKDIQFFDISSQVYYLLKQQNKLDQTPVFFQERLKENYTDAFIQSLFIKNQTERILEAFESEDIEVIPLKGSVFAEKYFGHVGARRTTDIDLLIKPSQLDDSIQGLKRLGFTIEGELIPAHFHCDFSKKIPGSKYPLTVEIHWGLLKDHTSDITMEDFWSEATPYKHYSFVKELSNFHSFYMICLHGWKHNMNSLKYFIDIIQLIHTFGDQLDYEVLFKEAHLHKTYKRMVRTLSIVYQEFPNLSEVKRLHKRCKNTWWQYAAFRNNQRSITQYVNLLHFQVLDLDSSKHRILALYRWLIPSKVELYFEIGTSKKRTYHYIDYLTLYKKRFAALWKLMTHRKTSQH